MYQLLFLLVSNWRGWADQQLLWLIYLLLISTSYSPASKHQTIPLKGITTICSVHLPPTSCQFCASSPVGVRRGSWSWISQNKRGKCNPVSLKSQSQVTSPLPESPRGPTRSLTSFQSILRPERLPGVVGTLAEQWLLYWFLQSPSLRLSFWLFKPFFSYILWRQTGPASRER